METKRFSCFGAAWQDVKNSPGWFGKAVLLALLTLVPVFGWIVAYGYLLGWARDVAWNIHAPLPTRIFGNEDGKLYSRGFFAWVIALVCLLVPYFAFTLLWSFVGVALAGTASLHHAAPAFMPFGILSGLFPLLLLVGGVFVAVLATFFQWIGWMRMAIYGRLSAGFQIGRAWAMLRHDAGGILRIFGMFLVVNVVTIVCTILLAFLMALFIMLAMIAAFGFALNSDTPSSVLVALLVMTVLMFALWLLCTLAYVISTMILTRALGYWTSQFDVAHWRGQDDPMPFELARANAAAQPSEPPRNTPFL